MRAALEASDKVAKLLAKELGHDDLALNTKSLNLKHCKRVSFNRI
jgi:hypothetical protein